MCVGHHITEKHSRQILLRSIGSAFHCSLAAVEMKRTASGILVAAVIRCLRASVVMVVVVVSLAMLHGIEAHAHMLLTVVVILKHRAHQQHEHHRNKQ